MNNSTTALETTAPQSIDVQSDRPQTHTWTYRPNVDVLDTPEAVLLMADMPGASSDSIDVSFENGILTIQASVQPRRRHAARPVLQEYGVGNFHRRFEVDETIDARNVSAEYRDGVLNVRLPKTQHARRHRVPVTG